MTHPDLQRRNRAVRRTQGWLSIVALTLALTIPAATVAGLLRDRLGWPDWPTVVVVALVFLAVGLRPVLGWVQRRTDDPARSSPRYVRVLIGAWVVGLVATAAFLLLLRLALPGRLGAYVADVAQIATAVLPFAAVALIERVRPDWLRHPARERAEAGARVA